MGNGQKKPGDKGGLSKGKTKTPEIDTLDEKKSEQCIIDKLKKGNRQALNMPEDELREWARSLCVPGELREWYLNPEFAGTKEAVIPPKRLMFSWKKLKS